MRAALLPLGQDPFLNAYWLRNYAEVWANEVDQLEVIMCGQSDPEVIDYMYKLVAETPHATMIRHDPIRVAHGRIITELVENTKADHVMFCEDDAYVRQPEAIRDAFEIIESGRADVVGSPRTCASAQILDAANSKWGDPPTTDGSGDTGHALWPCFLFASRDILLKTDHFFDARNWKPGEKIGGLGYVPVEPVSGDTFVSASFQLRDMGVRIEHRPQYRADGWCITHWGNIPWFHVGSLSSGYGNQFLSGQPEAVYQQRLRDALTDTTDYPKRCAFWRRAWRTHRGGIEQLHRDYGQALSRFIQDLSFGMDHYNYWDSAFQALVNWKE